MMNIASAPKIAVYSLFKIPCFYNKQTHVRERKNISEILRGLCHQLGVELIEGFTMPDRVHLCLNIPFLQDSL